jgi:predicted Zn-dependent protease
MGEPTISQRLPDASPAMLQREGMQALADRIHGMTKGGGRTVIRIQGWWRHQLQWGQNQLLGASESRDYSVVIERTVGGGTAVRYTNHITDEALAETVRLVEMAAAGAPKQVKAPTMSVLGKPQQTPTSAIWSDRSAQLTAEERAKVGAAITNTCAQHKIVSSGTLEVYGQEQMEFVYGAAPGSDGEHDHPNELDADTPQNALEGEGSQSGRNASREYVRYTSAFCRIAAYDQDGTGVGLGSSYDWGTIDTTKIVNDAIDQCTLSRNPIRLEPGRYPVVLHPQAVVVLTDMLVSNSNALDRQSAESGRSPFTQAPDQQLQLFRTKLGMKVIDERLTLRHDPLDPRLGVLPTPGLQAVTWIDKGILTNLAYSRSYAVEKLQQDTANVKRLSFILEGGSEASLDDLIANMSKGVLVTRLSNIQILNHHSLLVTGEAHGLCQIENGKITRAVAPMRFTDSPLMAFNAVEQIGASVPVFTIAEQGLAPMIAPPMSVREFALTATTTLPA